MINIINKNEIIVRFRSGESKRAIAKALGIARNTIDKYINEYNQLQQRFAGIYNDVHYNGSIGISDRSHYIRYFHTKSIRRGEKLQTGNIRTRS